MLLGKLRTSYLGFTKFILIVCLAIFVTATNGLAQVTASIIGTARDSSGAVVPGATITVRDVETGVTRTAETDAAGTYSVPSLSVGQYEVDAEKAGFKKEVRQGITLVVGQEAVVNLTLEIGNVQQEVTVTAEAPLVDTTVSSTSGLVSEKEVKDLPLNGRSFDQLLTLNTGIVNYSTVRSGGDLFSVAGQRPEDNRFTMNGVDYIGASSGENTLEPNGASGEVLGVDSIREFNVAQNTYGAEYGKHAGGQIGIVTTSGTNQLHGTLFEFLRNSIFDARNFFDHPIGERIPPFKRNQFGGSLGGPIKKDKLFLFGNYEALRLRLGVSDVAIVPDNNARLGLLPNAQGVPTPVAGLVPGMLPFLNYFWPAPNGPELGSGVAYDYANPLEKIREDYGLTRFDYTISGKDSFSANYMVQDGSNDTPSANPNFVASTLLRSQLLSLQETHVFSPALLNVTTLGFSRGHILDGTPPYNVTIPANLSFISGTPPGGITIGGSVTGAGSITKGGGGGFSYATNNFFTWADDLHYINGKHSWSAGVWIQRVETNTNGTATFVSGSISYPTLAAMLQNTPETLTAEPNPTELGFRSTEAAWYIQDEIKLKPNLTLRVGLRDEMTTGYNEVQGRCSNYTYTNDVISTTTLVGYSCLQANNAVALWQPRVGLAWDPTGKGTWSVRVAGGIYNYLQDNLAQKFQANTPYNERTTYVEPLLSVIPIPGGTQPPPTCSPTQGPPCSTFSPGGINPNMRTPTSQQWSLTVERGVTKDIKLQVGYVGSATFHIQTAEDPNTVVPQVCANPAGCVSGGILTTRGLAPQGALYDPPVASRPNSYDASGTMWSYQGNSSYEGLNIALIGRSSHGLTFKVNYTYSKVLDIISNPDVGSGPNETGVVLTRYDLALSKGPAAYDLQNQFNTNFSYVLPFGHGQRWGSGAGGVVNQIIGGWQWNGILTVQSGFPFTPQVGSNISGSGDAGVPDVPNVNPAFTGPVILGTVSHWFNPQAYTLPITGTFGNAGRNHLTGPGLTEFDTSFFKTFPIKERFNLEFRAELFNIINHANFGVPSPIVFSGTSFATSAGAITTTATNSRQIQFALKLRF